MGDILKFVTSNWGLRKKTQKKFCLFCISNSILRPLLIKFWFEKPVLSSAQRAQIKHKKNWRAQAKLLNVFSHDIMRKSRNEVKIF